MNIYIVYTYSSRPNNSTVNHAIYIPSPQISPIHKGSNYFGTEIKYLNLIMKFKQCTNNIIGFPLFSILWLKDN